MIQDITKMNLENVKLKNQIVRLKKILDDLDIRLITKKEIPQTYRTLISELISLYNEEKK